MSWREFEDYVQKVMAEENIAGLSVAVSQYGRTVYEKGFGFRDISTKEPVTPETIFGIASITKSFTAMAIMQLQEDGVLRVDDPVIKYLPEFKLCGAEDMSAIKIRHLLSHTTGCPPMVRRQDLNSLDDHIEYLATAEYKLLGKPGEYFSYCNDTFLLLGAIIERLTGKLYRRYITENILDTLGMYRSTFSLEEVGKYKDVSVPYDYNKDIKGLEEKPWPVLGNYEVGGGIRSCVSDLLKYGDVYVDRGIEYFDLVDHVSRMEMYQPVHRIGGNSFYGYALKSTTEYNGYTLVEHGGGQPGVSSNFGFVPEEKMVVAVLSNVGGVPVRKIWLAAVNAALGLPLDTKDSVQPHYDISGSELAALLGTYKSDEGSTLIVSMENNRAVANIAGETHMLRASAKDVLVLEKDDRPIRFFLGDDGVAWAVFLGMRTLRRV